MLEVQNKMLCIALRNFIEIMYLLDKDLKIYYENCGFNEDEEEVVGVTAEAKGEKIFIIFKAKGEYVEIF